MSSGRKSQEHAFRVTGTDRESILKNLTLAGGERRTDIERKTTTFKKDFGLGFKDDADVIAGKKILREQAVEKAKTMVDLSQEDVDTLNVRFKERASEVLRRTTFQGREQLVLTNRT